MESVGLRRIMTDFIHGKYDAYEFCFDAPDMLVHEYESERIMSTEQYEYLLSSALEDLCFRYEDDIDSFPGNKEVLTRDFINNIKPIYEIVMTM